MNMWTKRSDGAFRFKCPQCGDLSDWQVFDSDPDWRPYHDCGTKMKLNRNDFAGITPADEDLIC